MKTKTLKVHSKKDTTTMTDKMMKLEQSDWTYP